jgi:hypothetical protein
MFAHYKFVAASMAVVAIASAIYFKSVSARAEAETSTTTPAANRRNYRESPSLSGEVRTENRLMHKFNRIQLAGTAKVRVQVGGAPPSLSVTADSALLPYLETSVSDGMLKMTLKCSPPESNSVKVSIAANSLQGARLLGDGEIVVKGMNGIQFDADMEGHGMISASGAVYATHVLLEGQGHIDLHGLVTTNANAQLKGGGTIEVHATKALIAQVNGSGTILYGGAPPDLSRTINGSGSVTPRP